MTCGSCSTEIPLGARFCHECGSPINQEGSADGGLFDSSRQAESKEQAEARALETLKPYADEANRVSTRELISANEWLGRCITKRPKGPVPELRAQTQFFCLVYELASAREQYEEVKLTDLEELAKGSSIRLTLLDRITYDIELWKVILDPDGRQIKPQTMFPPQVEYMGGKTYHSAAWHFTAEDFASTPRPITVALLRIPVFDELRYTFPSEMR